MAFDPNQYQMEKAASADSAAFDPTRYQAEKSGTVDLVPAPSISEQIFPRASKTQGALKTIGAGALDLASLPGRIIMSNPSALVPPNPIDGPGKPPTQADIDAQSRSMIDTKGSGFLDKTIRDPATIPTAVMPLMEGPAMAGWLGKAATGAFKGFQIGTANAVMHQVGNYVQEKSLDMDQAAKEIMTGTGLGGLLSTFGEAGKALGTKIVRAAIKPGFIGTREGVNIDKAMEDGMAGSFGTMKTKFGELKDKAVQGINTALANNVNKNIPGGQLYTDLLNKTTQKINDGTFGLNHPEAKAALEDIRSRLAPMMDAKTGAIPLGAANKIKSSLQNDATRLYQASLVPNASVSAQDMIKEQLSRDLARKFGDAIEQAAPEIKQSNLDYAFAKPFNRAIKKREIIRGQSNPVSLDEAVMAENMGNFVTGEGDGGPLWKAIALRASKQPGIGNLIYQGGKILPMPVLRIGDILSNSLDKKSGDQQ